MRAAYARSTVAWLCLQLLTSGVLSTISPMRRKSGLRLLRRLAASDPNSVSVDIGGTLAKVVIFQPESAPPAEGETPQFELGEANEKDVAFWDLRQRELSVYLPHLHGRWCELSVCASSRHSQCARCAP